MSKADDKPEIPAVPDREEVMIDFPVVTTGGKGGLAFKYSGKEFTSYFPTQKIQVDNSRIEGLPAPSFLESGYYFDPSTKKSMSLEYKRQSKEIGRSAELELPFNTSH